MLSIYFLIILFIIIFNILIPTIIKRIEIENQIFDSKLGTNVIKTQCNNDYVFTIERKITGLELYYYLKDGNRLRCSETINDSSEKKKCGENAEFNSRNDPCFIFMSELLFYRNIK